MNNTWQEKLESLGASIDSVGNVSLQGADAADQALQTPPTGPTLVELSQLSIVDLTGTDARVFFQAQVCNDIDVLSDADVQLNGYCSPKGRLLSLFSVYTHNDGLRLIVPADVAPAFVKRLQMYVMRQQVTIQINEELVCSGLIIEGDALAKLESVSGLPNWPADVMGLSSHENAQAIRWHDANINTSGGNALNRYLLVATPDVLFTLWQSDQFKHAGYDLWRWGDIKAGMPNVFEASSDQFIPQMLNMQLIDGLSFKKGCYPGQEIVARMQYLGKLKKHMKQLRATGVTSAPSPGAVLSIESNNNAGQVVDAVVDEAGLNLLAVVNIATPVNEIHIDGVALEEVDLPYELVTQTCKA